MRTIKEESSNKENDREKLPLLIYDSECPLCERFKQTLERKLPQESFYTQSLHSDELYQDFPFLKKENLQKEVHLILSETQILKGPLVVEYLIKEFPIVKEFAWLIESAAGKKAIDVFYKTSNKYRKWLTSRCAGCQ